MCTRVVGAVAQGSLATSRNRIVTEDDYTTGAYLVGVPCTCSHYMACSVSGTVVVALDSAMERSVDE